MVTVQAGLPGQGGGEVGFSAADVTVTDQVLVAGEEVEVF